jgi:hypothetical protein
MHSQIVLAVEVNASHRSWGMVACHMQLSMAEGLETNFDDMAIELCGDVDRFLANEPAAVLCCVSSLIKVTSNQFSHSTPVIDRSGLGEQHLVCTKGVSI